MANYQTQPVENFQTQPVENYQTIDSYQPIDNSQSVTTYRPALGTMELNDSFSDGIAAPSNLAMGATLADTQPAFAAEGTLVALAGYSPVTVSSQFEWKKGNANIASYFDGRVYNFTSETEKSEFEETPSRYVPVLNGDCVVSLMNRGDRVPGSVHYSAEYLGRIYLFSSQNEKDMFLDKPEKFANADLAANGDCVVTRSTINRNVPGNVLFTTVHNGLRYQFLSMEQKDRFLANPSSFTNAAVSSTLSDPTLR